MQGDVKELRRLASIRGLVSPLLRRTAWPLLLGVQPHHTEALPCTLHAEPGARSARDEQTIRNDVARCLHASQIACVGENDREELRETLVRILKAGVDGETVYYYQACSLSATRVFMRKRCGHLRSCATNAKQVKPLLSVQSGHAVTAAPQRRACTRSRPCCCCKWARA